MAGAMWGVEGSSGAGGSRMKRGRSPAENEELELSLGLSSNGIFGVDPARKQKTERRRSTSVSYVVFNVVSAGDGVYHRVRGAANGEHAPLMRAFSAPPDARWWRRLELSDSAVRLGSEKLKKVDGLHGLEMWHSPKGATESRGQQSHLVKGETFQSCYKMLESQKGTTQTTPTGSSSGHPVVDEASGKEVPTVTSEASLLKNAMSMPYVFTQGLGPHQNKIRGYLYKYKKLEDVQIICFCHGTFHSPAGFVKHGGGSDDDVANPLKRIVVRPVPFQHS